MIYKRILEDKIKSKLFKGQIIILYGPRQVGKTTLVKKIFNQFEGEKKYFQGDIPSERAIFEVPEPAKIMPIIGKAKLIIIDEAQLIQNIGVTLKVLFDTQKDIQIITTGSSSFDLANKIREPLTGRALEYMMYPLAFEEIKNEMGLMFLKQNFENLLNYGFYPKVLGENIEDAKTRLALLQNNTLYKDIFALENIKKPKVLQDLVTFLAINIGSMVKVGNIAREIKSTEKTIERYIDLLEKMFVIVKIYAYSNNLNNEIKKGFKIYFTDVGFRNSIINKFADLELRLDKGQLFENFFVIERIKYLNNNQIIKKKYFWQNYAQVEIDYLEESDGFLEAFECKFLARKTKSINLFKNQYQKIIKKIHIVDKENYSDFLG
ncbi:MAG: ATP-binding protein [Patescibacteria group bacterium]